ncbi:MAG: hypothetical protein KCHDKBKB_01027 [Elusimicrobia bacterium]|nr:hypothetical protein [Elusimicrobiota bacterium]
MKTLVATDETQGKRKNDFCHTRNGEFLLHGFECERESVDGPCGCRRSFSGMESFKATTTFKVVKTNLTKKQFTSHLAKALVKGGWYQEPLSPADTKTVSVMAAKLLNLAASFPIGAILERRGTRVSVRQHASKRPIGLPSKKGLD